MTTLVTTDVATGQTIEASVPNNNMAAIKAVVNGGIDNGNINAAAAIGISKLAGYPSSSTVFLRGDGTWASAGAAPGFTTSLPGAPSDAQEHVLVDSTTASTYHWRFRYNASAVSSYKWEFIGGAPAYAAVDTQENFTTGGTIHDLSTTGPTITVPVAGDYLIRWGMTTTPQTGGSYASDCSAEIWNGTSAQLGSRSAWVANSGSLVTLLQEERIAALSASTAVRVRYKNNIGGGSGGYAKWRFLEITPIRVI